MLFTVAYLLVVVAGVFVRVRRLPRTDTPVAWMLWSAAWAARWYSLPSAILGRVWFAVVMMFIGQVLMIGAGVAFRLDEMPK